MREKLMFQNAPHVRQRESVLTIMTDVIIALIPLYVMSFFYYGARDSSCKSFALKRLNYCCNIIHSYNVLKRADQYSFLSLLNLTLSTEDSSKVCRTLKFPSL